MGHDLYTKSSLRYSGTAEELRKAQLAQTFHESNEGDRRGLKDPLAGDDTVLTVTRSRYYSPSRPAARYLLTVMFAARRFTEQYSDDPKKDPSTPTLAAEESGRCVGVD
jgi:hypothetical protein